MASLSMSIFALLFTFLFKYSHSCEHTFSPIFGQWTRFASILVNTPSPVAITTDVSTTDPESLENLFGLVGPLHQPMIAFPLVSWTGPLHCYWHYFHQISIAPWCFSYSFLNCLTDVSFSSGEVRKGLEIILQCNSDAKFRCWLAHTILLLACQVQVRCTAFICTGRLLHS